MCHSYRAPETGWKDEKCPLLRNRLLKAIATGTAGVLIDAALSPDSMFLYVEESPVGAVQIFRVDGTNLRRGSHCAADSGIRGIDHEPADRPSAFLLG